MRKTHLKDTIAIMFFTMAVLLGITALRPVKAMACDYIPTWNITVKPQSPTVINPPTTHYFYGWDQQEAMLAFIETETNPNNPLTIVEISNGGMCLDGSTQPTSPTPTPPIISPTITPLPTPSIVQSFVPTWTVAVSTNGVTTYQAYTGWYRRFAMLDYVTNMSDPFPQFGVPWHGVVITDWRQSN